MNRPLVMPATDAGNSAFERWWDTRGEWVEAPNQRRAGQSGVQRITLRDAQRSQLYCKRQVGHLYRSLRYPLGRPTVLREQRALLAFRDLGVRVPHILFCEARRAAGGWQALLVTNALNGFVSLEDWYRDAGWQCWGASLHQNMLCQLAETLSRIHRSRWQHGCCYPKHVFVKVHGEGDTAWVEIALLDLEKSRRRLSRSAASQHDLSQLLRHRGSIPLSDFEVFRQAYQAAFAGARGDARAA